MASFSDARAHLRSSSITRLSAAQSYTLVLQQDAPTAGAVAAVGSSSAATDAAATAAVYKKVSVRLLPLFMTMLVLNWLDRSCLAFASIQMTQELHFTPEVRISLCCTACFVCSTHVLYSLMPIKELCLVPSPLQLRSYQNVSPQQLLSARFCWHNQESNQNNPAVLVCGFAGVWLGFWLLLPAILLAAGEGTKQQQNSSKRCQLLRQ
jgi:hypothetical protein